MRKTHPLIELLLPILPGSEALALHALQAHPLWRNPTQEGHRIRMAGIFLARRLVQTGTPGCDALWLKHLVESSGAHVGWALTPTAVENLEPPGPDMHEQGCTRTRLRRERWVCPDRGVLTMQDTVDPASVGPDLEEKLRLCHLARALDGTLELDFDLGTWKEGRRFHQAMLGSAGSRLAPETHMAWLDAISSGQPRVPDITAVHVIVGCADAQLVMLQRSPRVSYFPSHWSLSLEEQLTLQDFTASDPLQAATHRALKEELGIALEPGLPVHVHTAFVDLAALSCGIVAQLSLPIELEQVREAWRRTARSRHGWEASALVGVPADPEWLEAIAWDRGEGCPMPLHPSSRLRMLLAARRLRASQGKPIG